MSYPFLHTEHSSSSSTSSDFEVGLSIFSSICVFCDEVCGVSNCSLFFILFSTGFETDSFCSIAKMNIVGLQK